MKKILLYITCVLTGMACHAQMISINAQVVDERIPEEAARQLETKLQNALTQNGYADNGYTERFVLTAKVDVTQKNVTPTPPARISEKMNITLMVGDVVENKLYASVTLQAAGIGINENKAYIQAFRSIKGDSPKIQQMLNEAKEKIIDYYTSHCGEIKQRANALVAQQKYEEAIFMLGSVPNINENCFSEWQQQTAIVYQQKIDADAKVLLEQAKNIWAAKPNNEGAEEIADIISQINPNASIYADVVNLRSAIEAKLQADAKQEWDFKMRQYEDTQQFKRSLVDAGKAIGVAWAKNQTKTIYKTIIRNWW